MVDKWLIFGHRRWATIIGGELSKLLSESQMVDIFFDGKDDAENWALSNKNTRLNPVFAIPKCEINKKGVAIIANSAYLHFSSINKALDAGYHVICEKPLTFAESETLALIKKAFHLDKRIFPSNTFVFADYMHIFKNNWLSKRIFTDIAIEWFDPKLEFRYEIDKRYDSSVPIIFDVLPHITSIIFVLLGHRQFNNYQLSIDGGGSKVKLLLHSSDIKIDINLSRMAKERRRVIRLNTKKEEIFFDFTIEPGFIKNNDGLLTLVDGQWNEKRKPISEMLHSVINYFANSSSIDERFSMAPTLMANQIADNISGEYVKQQLHHLRHFDQKNQQDNEYALKEINSLRQRALNYLPTKSHFNKLIKEAEKSNLLNHQE